MTTLLPMNLTIVSQNFPSLPKHEVLRDSFLLEIETLFNSGFELVTVNGIESIGKTTLLSQFAGQHPDNAISIFVDNSSRWNYDPENVRYDLCNQINWFLYNELIKNPDDVSDTLLRKLLTQLRLIARQKQETIYFILDGIGDIPDEEIMSRDVILEMFPWKSSHIKFLISGDPIKLNLTRRNISTHPVRLTGFSFDDTMRYFRDRNPDESLMRELWLFHRGSPGGLASARRSFENGLSIEEYLKQVRIENSPYEIEWREVTDSPDQQLLLAIIAQDQKLYSISDLSRLTQLPETDVEHLIQSVGFVSIDPQTKQTTYVADVFRRIAGTKLHHLRETVDRLVIDDLYRDPFSEVTLASLPTALQRAGRFDELLTYLSPENIQVMLQRVQSLGFLRDKARLGMTAAEALHRDGEIMRFGMQVSAIEELDGAEVWRSEIEARIALNDYDAALTLAQSMSLDFLHNSTGRAPGYRGQRSG